MPKDTSPNIRSSNASDAKHMDTRLKTVQGLQYVDDAHKNMRQRHALQKPANAQTAVVHILPGTTSAQEELKNMKN